MLDSTRITVLDVGQGQCILLQSEGRTYMVDCGGDSDTETADIAAETLLSQGISRLDGLILTHGDRDHTGAAENLLSRVKADILILPPEEGMPTSDNAEVVYAEQDLLLTYGKTNLHIFTTDSNRSENENSLCVLFDTENCDILITGDRSAYGERMLLPRRENPGGGRADCRTSRLQKLYLRGSACRCPTADGLHQRRKGQSLRTPGGGDPAAAGKFRLHSVPDRPGRNNYHQKVKPWQKNQPPGAIYRS